MVDLVLGIGAAVGASTLYSLGIALQAMDAREAPHEEHLRLALVWGLVRRARWLLGTGLSILGWPLQVVALLLAPLVVVQPALATGLLVLLFLAERMLGEHAGRYEHIAMWAIVLGVLGAALTAPPRSTSHTSEQLTITLVLVGLGVASLLPYLLRALGSHPRERDHDRRGPGVRLEWRGDEARLRRPRRTPPRGGRRLGPVDRRRLGRRRSQRGSALQSRPAIQVAPVVFVTQTVIPVVLAPLLLGERFSATPLDGVPLGVSLAVLIAGAALLARSPLLLALMEGEAVSHPSGSAPSPDEPSQATMRSSPSTEAGDPSSSTTRTSPARIVR